MLKRLLFLFSLIALLSTAGYAQWANQGIFPPSPDTLFGNTGGHGVAVDPDGKVWIVPYRPFKTDSVFVPDSNKYFNSRPVYVYNANGTPAPFSPIKLVQTPEKKNKVVAFSKTGISTNNKGNILVNDYDELIMIDYKTGAGMHWAGLTVTNGSSLCKVASDSSGMLYVSYTLDSNPLKILNPDLSFNTNAVDTLPAIGRTTDVSPDGNTIYAHRYTLYMTLVYHRNSEFEPYIVTDSAFKGFQTEGSNWNPKNKLLYISAGSYNNPPQTTGQGLFYPKATIGTYYGINVSKKPYQILDSVSWKFVKAGNPDERNRGIAFSPDGKTAYLVAFGASTYPIVEKYTTTNLPGGVKRENNNVVESYALSQNYPNPFNPSTEIKFSVAKEGDVTLKVYDMLGKEIATLVNEKLSAGNYTTSFNGSGFASGIYIYQLSANGVVISHKMTLLK